jgi:ribosome maturation factor RimP
MKSELSAIAETVCTQFSASLIDLEVKGDRRQVLIRIYADHEQGITLGQCEQISREMQDRIDMDDLVQGDYRLEVSSPGIGRSLQFPFQYKRHLGKEIKIVRNDVEKSEVRGVLTAVQDEGIQLQAGEQEQIIPFGEINKALIQLKW